LRLSIFLFLGERWLAMRSLHNDDIWLSGIAALAGILVLAGLWAPISAAVITFLELWLAIRTGETRDAHLLAAALAAGLTVLGPGAWSVDARLFGRRRISIEDR
jgi:putative oxidoreductase